MKFYIPRAFVAQNPDYASTWILQRLRDGHDITIEQPVGREVVKR